MQHERRSSRTFRRGHVGFLSLSIFLHFILASNNCFSSQWRRQRNKAVNNKLASDTVRAQRWYNNFLIYFWQTKRRSRKRRAMHPVRYQLLHQGRRNGATGTSISFFFAGKSRPSRFRSLAFLVPAFFKSFFLLVSVPEFFYSSYILVPLFCLFQRCVLLLLPVCYASFFILSCFLMTSVWINTAPAINVFFVLLCAYVRTIVDCC